MKKIKNILSARKDFGNRLCKIRKKRGISQEELAAELGYKTGGSVSNIESGRSPIGTPALAMIAEAFDVDLHWLITGDISPGERRAKEVAHSALMRIAGYFAIQLGELLSHKESSKAELLDLLKRQEAGEAVDGVLIETLRISLASMEKSLQKMAKDQPWVHQALENIGRLPE